jgi:Flp pilus assembly protein CpaB
MRASTLFAITLSVLLGLGAVAGARYAGLFDKKEPPPPPPDKAPIVKVLVAGGNLYQGIAVTADQVMVKDFRLTGKDEADWRADANKFQSKFVPATPGAISYRIPKRNITADTPLLENDFEKPELAPSITERLEPGTSPVNVAISKGRSVGGTIRLNEYVDVWLTTRLTIGSGKDARETSVSACIAKDCKVVMKRNVIWPMFGIDPDDKPVNFTLQTNPYRAALIEHAMGRGELTLRPVPAPATKATNSFVNMSSPEYADEDTRVDLIKRNMYTMSDADLMRIFNIRVPAPPPPAPPPPPPLQTRVIHGTGGVGTMLYNPDGTGPYTGPPPATSAQQQAAQQAPVVTLGGRGKQATDCENCGTK